MPFFGKNNPELFEKKSINNCKDKYLDLGTKFSILLRLNFNK